MATYGMMPTDLGAKLVRVASDPALVRQLYDVLGGFCHEIRNDLNGLKMTLYMVGPGAELAAREGLADPSGEDGVPALWERAQAQYDQLEELIERIHRFCRGGTIVPLALPVGLLFEDRRRDWDAALRARGRSLTFQPPREEVDWPYDPGRLGPALDDLFAWRLEAAEAGSALRIAWRRAGESLVLDWREESRGPRAGRPARARESNRARALLCLPALAQAVALHGGTAEVSAAEGWRLRMQWPRGATGPAERRDAVDQSLRRADPAVAN